MQNASRTKKRSSLVPLLKHAINTCAHDVLPKEWYPEQARQHRQAGSHAGKCLSKAAALRAEAGKGSSTHDAMWVRT